MKTTVTLRDQLVAGVIAGIAGGMLIDLFLFGAQVSAGAPLGQVVTGTWAWIASVVMGPSVLANPAAPAIGGVLHFAVSIGWALGYVYLVRSQPQLLARPWLSGTGFGLVVYVFMQIVLLTAGAYHRPSPGALLTGLVAHTLFYGIPVALIVSRILGRSRARA